MNFQKNASWVIAAGYKVALKMQAEGSTALSPRDRLINCLWEADYGMRNAGDLANARDLYPDFLDDGLAAASALSLPHGMAAFSLSLDELEIQYFDLFEPLADEIRALSPYAGVEPVPSFEDILGPLDYAPLNEEEAPVDVGQALSDKTPFPLPADYLSFLARFPVTGIFEAGTVCAGLQPSEFARDGLYSLETLYGYSSSDTFNILKAWLPDDIGPEFLRIGDGHGNPFFLKLDGDDAGSVFYHDHETNLPEGLVRIASSFSDFVQRLEPYEPDDDPQPLTRRAAPPAQMRLKYGAFIVLGLLVAGGAVSWHVRSPVVLGMTLFGCSFLYPLLVRFLAWIDGQSQEDAEMPAVFMPWRIAAFLLPLYLAGCVAAWLLNSFHLAVLVLLMAIVSQWAVRTFVRRRIPNAA